MKNTNFKKLLKEQVIDPNKKFIFYWLCIISNAVLYNIVFILLRVVFSDLQTDYFFVWFFFDCSADLLYIVDSFIQLRTAYYSQGILIVDVTTLGKTYLKTSRCWLGVLSFFPTDILYLLGRQNCIIRINRFLRTYRLFEAWDKIESETSRPNVFRIFTLVCKILISLHCCTCLYYQFSKWSGIGSTGFVFAKDPADNSTLYDYTYCYYWSTMMMLSLAEMPKPTKDYEYFYGSFVLIVGFFFVAYIVGDIGTTVSNLGAQRSQFSNRLDAVKRYLVYRKIDKSLETEVMTWFDYLKGQGESNFASNDDRILELLPPSLQVEINSSVHAETLKRVELFKNCDKGFLNQLVLKLRPIVYGPGDYVCRKGDIGKEMYILKKGRLAVVSLDGKKIIVRLSEGAVFGEISLLNILGNKNGNRRTANIRSVGYSELFYLSKEDLWEALKEYPETEEALLEKGKSFLRNDNMLDESTAEKECFNCEEQVLIIQGKLFRLQDTVAHLLGQILSAKVKLNRRANNLKCNINRLHKLFELQKMTDK